MRFVTVAISLVAVVVVIGSATAVAASLMGGDSHAQTLAMAGIGQQAPNCANQACVTLSKVCPEATGDAFDIHLLGPADTAAVGLTCNSQVDFPLPLTPGDYSVAERLNNDASPDLNDPLPENYRVEYGGDCADAIIAIPDERDGTCTITNTLLDAGDGLTSLTIIKDVIGPNGGMDPQDFAFSSDLPAPCDDLGVLDDDNDPVRGNTVTCTGIPNNTTGYHISEDFPGSWGFPVINCMGPEGRDGEWDWTSDLSTLTIKPNAGSALDITCTFTNQAPNFHLTKDCGDAAGGTFSVDLTPTQPGDAYGFTIVCGQEYLISVKPGQYTVTEDILPDSFDGPLLDGCNGGDIEVASDQVYECVVENTPIGDPDVDLTKQCLPDNSLEGPFIVRFTNTDDDTVVSVHVVCGQTIGVYLRSEQTYEATEDTPDGIDSEITGDCSQPITVPARVTPGNAGAAQAAFTCTVTNSPITGSLTIVKDIYQGESDALFSFTTDIPGCAELGPVDDDGNNANTYSNTVVCPNVTWDQSYVVQEVLPAGWGFLELQCDGNPSNPSYSWDQTGRLEVEIPSFGDPATDVTCTFVNDKLDLIAEKQCDQVDENAEFVIEAIEVGQTDPAASEIVQCGESAGFFLEPGEYTVQELVLDGEETLTPEEAGYRPPVFQGDCTFTVVGGFEADPARCTVINQPVPPSPTATRRPRNTATPTLTATATSTPGPSPTGAEEESGPEATSTPGPSAVDIFLTQVARRATPTPTPTTAATGSITPPSTGSGGLLAGATPVLAGAFALAVLLVVAGARLLSKQTARRGR